MQTQPRPREVDTHLGERIRSSRSLPSPPVIAARLIEIGQDPDVEIGDIVEVLRTDPAMSARLLRLANSPIYARNRRVESLRQAVTLLGIDAVLTASLSLTLLSSTAGSRDSGLSFQDRWTRSVHSAVSAQIFAERCAEIQPGDAFLASLLQDIGVLVIGRLEPETYASLGVGAAHDAIVGAEIEALGVDHAAVGAELLDAWHLPVHVVDAVRMSHRVSAAEKNAGALTYLVAIGGLIAEWMAGDAPALDLAADLASVIGIDERSFAVSIDAASLAIPELASLLDAEVPDPDVLAEMATDVILARQMMGHETLVNLRGELETMANMAADIEVEGRIDPVTGLSNRRYLDDCLERHHRLSREHGYPMTLLFVDLDDFKSINDRHGHQVGDVILAKAASLLSSSVRDDDLVGRYGGDEFVIVLPSTDLRAASVVADRVVAAFDCEPVWSDGLSGCRLSVSVGLASTEHSAHRGDLARLIRAADVALFEAKRAGRGCWRVTVPERSAGAIA